MAIDSVNISSLITRFVGSSSQTLTGSRLLHPQRLVLWSGEGTTVIIISIVRMELSKKNFAEQKIYFGFTVDSLQQFWRTLWIVWSAELRCLWDFAKIEIIFNSSFIRLCQLPDQNGTNAGMHNNLWVLGIRGETEFCNVNFYLPRKKSVQFLVWLHPIQSVWNNNNSKCHF